MKLKTNPEYKNCVIITRKNEKKNRKNRNINIKERKAKWNYKEKNAHRCIGIKIQCQHFISVLFSESYNFRCLLNYPILVNRNIGHSVDFLGFIRNVRISHIQQTESDFFLYICSISNCYRHRRYLFAYEWFSFFSISVVRRFSRNLLIIVWDAFGFNLILYLVNRFSTTYLRFFVVVVAFLNSFARSFVSVYLCHFNCF